MDIIRLLKWWKIMLKNWPIFVIAFCVLMPFFIVAAVQAVLEAHTWLFVVCLITGLVGGFAYLAKH